MTYGLIYTIPFQTMLQKKNCVVEIEKEGYEGESTELIAAGTPFTVDIDDEEFLYTPTRFSTANMNVVGKDYLQSLFTTDYRQHRVTLLVDGHVAWCGFVKPEVYTQDYVSETFELEMECMSAMSVLEYIDFTTQGTEKKFVSLWSLLQKCISEAQARYEAVHIPFVYGRTKEQYTAGENVLKEMMISEQNFFDEDGKPMKLKEVLEEICKFLNWTCADWKGELYFVDMDHTGTYHKYDPTLTDKTDEAVNELIVQDVGFAGSDHSLDILPGYNKVTVRCSNYPVEELIPELFDEDLLQGLIKTSPYFKEVQVDENYRYFVKLYKNDSAENVFSDPESLEDMNINIEDYGENADNLLNTYVGGIITKQAYYKKLDGIPYTLDFSGSLLIGMGLNNKSFSSLTDMTLHLMKKVPIIKFSGEYMNAASLLPTGSEIMYILIKGEYFQSDTLYTSPEKAGEYNLHNVPKQALMFKLKIGDKYWDGNIWTTEESSFTVECGTNDDNGWYTWLNVSNGVKYNMNIGEEGYPIPIRNTDKVSGIIEFTIMRPRGIAYGKGGQIYKYPYYSMIRNLSVKVVYGIPDEEKKEDSDRLYENVLNETFINELDEIELKISSYNNDGPCYSKVVMSDEYVRDNVYNHLLDKLMRPENLLISRIISHYSTTRYKLTEVLMNDLNLSPFTRMSDKYTLDKKYINCGGSIDFQKDSFSFIMIEV